MQRSGNETAPVSSEEDLALKEHTEKNDLLQNTEVKAVEHSKDQDDHDIPIPKATGALPEAGGYVIAVGGVELPVCFEDVDVQPALVKAITVDITHLLSPVHEVRWRERKRPVEWNGKTITHDLGGVMAVSWRCQVNGWQCQANRR